MSFTEQEPVSPDPVIRTLSDYEMWAAAHLARQVGASASAEPASTLFTERNAQLAAALEEGNAEQIMYSLSGLYAAVTLTSINAGITLQESLTSTYRDAFPKSLQNPLEVINQSARDYFWDVNRRRAPNMLESNWSVIARAAVRRTALNVPNPRQFPTSREEQLLKIRQREAAGSLANTALLTSVIAQKFGEHRFEDVLARIIKGP